MRDKTVEAVYPETFKRYNIKDIKVVYHNIAELPDEENIVKCVEFLVVGKNNEWPNWARYDEFAKVNPDLTIPEE